MFIKNAPDLYFGDRLAPRIKYVYIRSIRLARCQFIQNHCLDFQILFKEGVKMFGPQSLLSPRMSPRLSPRMSPRTSSTWDVSAHVSAAAAGKHMPRGRPPLGKQMPHRCPTLGKLVPRGRPPLGKQVPCRCPTTL